MTPESKPISLSPHPLNHLLNPQQTCHTQPLVHLSRHLSSPTHMHMHSALPPYFGHTLSPISPSTPKLTTQTKLVHPREISTKLNICMVTRTQDPKLTHAMHKSLVQTGRTRAPFKTATPHHSLTSSSSCFLFFFLDYY